jgi:hypothetical protein
MIFGAGFRPSCSVAGWSSLVARKAHNLEVSGSNPLPATKRLFRKGSSRNDCVYYDVMMTESVR